MRYALRVAVLLMAGCASDAAKESEKFDVASREPTCARQCLAQHAACASSAGGTMNRFIANDMLIACNGTTRQCLSTCPAK